MSCDCYDCCDCCFIVILEKRVSSRTKYVYSIDFSTNLDQCPFSLTKTPHFQSEEEVYRGNLRLRLTLFFHLYRGE